MSISGAQHGRHTKEWNLVCQKQGWDPKDAAVRLAFYRKAGLPESRASWHPVTDFNTFLAACKPLQNQVDIRDRERETVEVSIVRLSAAIAEITGIEADRYVVGITADMSDSGEPFNLPLDPREDQRARGVEKIRPDLANLRDTLKNRLSKLLTKLKTGKLDIPAGREWWVASGNNAVITAILSGKICIRVYAGNKSFPKFVSQREYDRLQARKNEPATPAPHVAGDTYQWDADPVAIPPKKKAVGLRPAMRVSDEALAIATNGEDIDIPF